MQPDQQRKVIKVPIKKTLVIIVVLALCVFAYCWVTSNMRRSTGIGVGGAIPSPSIPSSVRVYGDERYYNNSGNISDTREFLKVSYSASIKTRDVSQDMKDIKNSIRDVEGRIDSSSVSEKNGYISFVVPKSKFEEFREEIESMTHKKLYSESVSSTNLLGQKQSIESQMQDATTTLASLEQQKKSLDVKHSQTLAVYKKDLASVRASIAANMEQQQTTRNQDTYEDLGVREADLRYQESSLLQGQDNENSNYASESERLNRSITAAKNNISGVKNKDVAFTDNIETVNGSISVTWTSWWNMAKIFSPIHPSIILAILAVVVVAYLNRRGFIPKIEFV